MSKRLIWWVNLIVVGCLVVTLQTIYVYANTLESPNYKIDEPVIGVGNIDIGSSTSYQMINSTGDIAIGNATSGNYQVEAGHTTTPDPTLSFEIIDGDVNFDDFTASGATTTTATFSVINYTSYGYVVQITGTPPRYGSHTIEAMSSTGASQPGTEQFGINLVANTAPVNFGADPDHGQFGFGSAATNYDAPNQFRFVSGETVAEADKSSGKTIYTISYLINVSSITPGGQYNGEQTLIITGTY